MTLDDIRSAMDLKREKRIAALRGRRAELHILYRSCPPAHRQRVRGLIADIEEELRDLGDEPSDDRLDPSENLLTCYSTVD
jgi:hypothetical protein